MYNSFEQKVAPELKFWSVNRNLVESASWFPLYAIFAKLQFMLYEEKDEANLLLLR